MIRFVLLALFLVPAAQAQAAYDVTLPTGRLDGAARDAFERGIELLHSFEYDDARDAFQQAHALDPGAAMPLWGEAMTHNHPVWQQQDTVAGRAALARISADAERQPHLVAYLESARVLFGDGEKEDRDDEYLASMRALTADYPEDRDGRAFLALALLGSAHEGRDYGVYGDAADAAQAVLDEAPKHPGALHYLIHAYDDPDHAELALPAARAYSEIVSAASHALHMPTHIYFALGLWDEASALNARAFQAAVDASARRGEPLNNHGWHALYWLAYSELQRDRIDAARAVLEQARSLYALDSSRLALAHLVRIRSHLVAGAQTAERPIAEMIGEWTALPREEMSSSTLAADLLAETYVLGLSRDAPGAADRIGRAEALLADSSASPSVRATALMVAAFHDLNEGGFAKLGHAIDLIDASPVDFGPPSPAVFPHETLAVFYEAAGRSDTADCVLESVLARAPSRRLTTMLVETLAETRSISEQEDALPDPDAFLGDLPQLPAIAMCDG